MELGLSLGEAFMAAEKAVPAQQLPSPVPGVHIKDGSGFLLGLGVALERREADEKEEDEDEEVEEEEEQEEEEQEEAEDRSFAQPSPQLRLSLLPFSPVPSRSSPMPGRDGLSWPSSETRNASLTGRGFDVNQPPTAAEELEEEAAASRGSDEEENGAARKKLRLSKEQSAFLEESFKEHSTLNPKQKLAVAKQLHLRTRQVEVWFQNRRARTKLKQTEVDYEYLKRCCETLTEENRRLQKELADLRALKSTNPFFTHLPATTLSMCPSCERVAYNTTPQNTTPTATSSTTSNASATTTSLGTAPVTSSAGAVNIAVTAAAASFTTAAEDLRPNSFAALFSKHRHNPFASSRVALPLQQPSTTS